MNNRHRAGRVVAVGVTVALSLVTWLRPAGAGLSFTGSETVLLPHAWNEVIEEGGVFAAIGSTFEAPDDRVLRLSTDGGRTWTAAGETCSSAGVGTALAGAPGGGWGVAAVVDGELVFCRSTDGGFTWEAEIVLSEEAEGTVASYGGWSRHDLESGGGGTWLATWLQRDELAGTNFVMAARSGDSGASWAAPVHLTTPAYEGAGINWGRPSVETDGTDTWLISWEITTGPGEREIAYVRSTDAAASWGPIEFINTNHTATVGHYRPDLATDGQGNWVAVWVGDYPYPRPGCSWCLIGNINVAYSSDNGASWSDTSLLHGSFLRSPGDDEEPRVAVDGLGRWLVAWRSNDALGGRVGRTDWDPLVSHSRDAGRSWSAPAAVSPAAGGNGENTGWAPKLAASDSGDWVLMSWGSAPGNVYVSTRDCTLAPASGCTAGDKSGLKIKHPRRGARAGLSWKWKSNSGVAVADFADPTTGSDYLLCAWEQVGASPTLVLETDVAADADCQGSPCWTARAGEGFSYRDKEHSSGVVGRVGLRAKRGRGRIKFQAGGVSFLAPVLPLSVDPGVTVQLHNRSNGACWDAEYSSPRRNNDRLFVAR